MKKINKRDKDRNRERDGEKGTEREREGEAKTERQIYKYIHISYIGIVEYVKKNK